MKYENSIKVSAIGITYTYIPYIKCIHNHKMYQEVFLLMDATSSPALDKGLNFYFWS